MDELNPNHPSRFFIRPTKHRNVSNRASDYLETVFVVGYENYTFKDKNHKLHIAKAPIVEKVREVCYN